jgi:hypothetical protein
VYPHQSELNVCGKDVVVHRPGMTYRQLVAKDMLIEYIRAGNRAGKFTSSYDAAHWAVDAADKLIAALDKSRVANGGSQ